jgi:hypothetical protein
MNVALVAASRDVLPGRQDLLNCCPGRSILPEWTFGKAEPELVTQHALNTKLFEVHPGGLSDLLHSTSNRSRQAATSCPAGRTYYAAARQAGPTGGWQTEPACAPNFGQSRSGDTWSCRIYPWSGNGDSPTGRASLQSRRRERYFPSG